MKKIFTLLFVLGLAGCVNTVAIKAEQKTNLHNVAIVSLLGSELEFTKVGFTVFNNDHFVRGSAKWNLDAEVHEIITAELQRSSPDIKVAQVPFDRVELLKIYKSPQSWGEYASIDRIEPALKNKLNQAPVDAVILVYKQRGEDPIASTSVFLEGYGVYYRSLPFVDPLMRPYALFSIAVLDGKTLKPITTKYVRGVSTEYGKTKVSWDDQIKNNLSEQMLVDFQSAISNVIGNNLVSGLTEMGL